MNYNSPKIACLLLFSGSVIALPAHSGWLWWSKEPEVTLDATLTIEAPFQKSFAINVEQFDATVIYHAFKTDEKGVKTYVHKSHSNPTIWVPWVSTYKERLAVERELKIKPEWIRLTAPNKVVIHLPERLPGPGDYRLLELRLACKAALCHEQLSEYRTFFFSNGYVEADVPAVLSLGNDITTTLTAAYHGVLMHATFSQGSHADKLLGYSHKDMRAVQDAAGTWHISDTAFKPPYEEPCSHVSWNSLTPPGPLDPEKYPILSWSRPFTELRQGEVYPGYTWHDDGTRTVKSISQFTGCIELEAVATDYNVNGSEVRQYQYRDGKLWARDVNRYAYGKSYREWLELDGDQKLLFFTQHWYDHSTNKEGNFKWNRLEHEAYPDEVPAESVEWGIPQAIIEGQGVLEIVK